MVGRGSWRWRGLSIVAVLLGLAALCDARPAVARGAAGGFHSGFGAGFHFGIGNGPFFRGIPPRRHFIRKPPLKFPCCVRPFPSRHHRFARRHGVWRGWGVGGFGDLGGGQTVIVVEQPPAAPAQAARPHIPQGKLIVFENGKPHVVGAAAANDRRPAGDGG